MKTVMLSTSDLYGGAYIAAYRLHKELLKQKIDSRMIVQKKACNDKTVIGLPDIFGKYIPILDQIPMLLMKTKNTMLHSPAIVPEFTVSRLNKFKPDLVHIEWINRGHLNPESLRKIKVPIVWTLHDMWAFCGAEHYSDTNRFIEGYNNNNRPSYEKGPDFNKWVWSRKFRAWKNVNNLTIITPSVWLANLAKKSFLFKNRNVIVIPNGLDTKVFFPMNKLVARKKLKLPVDKKILLFGAQSVMDERKGGDMLLKILSSLFLSDKNNSYLLVTYGSGDITPLLQRLGIDPKRVKQFEFIKEEKKLRMLYSSADLYLMTSRIENLPNTIMESMSCGTPTVAFNVGGIGDLIDNDVNGILVDPFKIEYFCGSINKIISDPIGLKKMSNEARKKVLKSFDIRRVTKKYLELYNSLLDK